MVHGFIRGISGAVVTFPTDNEPKLWLSSEDELKRDPEPTECGGPRCSLARPAASTTTASFLKDFQFTKTEPEGGQLADGGNAYWEALDKANGGNRVVLVDRIISQEDESELDEAERTHPLYFCRYCGSAAPGRIRPLLRLRFDRRAGQAVRRPRDGETARATQQLPVVRCPGQADGPPLPGADP